ncbi:MAG: TRAP transporter large permease [Candidatus Rokubacteria bacterium]|nr:TRAP transporter large permease [Candidatus Rokubacteria bacterium]
MGWALALIPFTLLALGLPVFLILLVTVIVVLAFFVNVPFTVVPQTMFGSIDKFALLAVPFFIFAGEVMGQGGISDRLIRWIQSMFGGVRGSLALTTVGTCEFFGAISGSSPATVAAVGRIMYPALRAGGYEEKFALGLVTSSGAVASIIPPSILMILYGAAAEQSVAALFIGGVFPGLLIGLMTATYIVVYAHRTGLARGEGFRWEGFWRATRDGVWALGAPVVILGSIYTGVCTPTEAAGIAGVYGVLVTRYVYRDITWARLWDIAVSSVFLTAQIMIIVAAAGVFSWLLTISGVPQTVVGVIQALDAPPWLMLVAINVCLLVVGCLIDPTSATLVLTPLLVPIASAIGMDLIHFGIILTVNLSIGMFTPPFGLNVFVSQALFKAPMARIARGLAPFIAIQVAALMLVTYVPWLSLYLTRFVR